MANLTENIQSNMPFISIIHYGNNEYVGIIINQDPTVTSLYDLSAIKSSDDRAAFLEAGEIWWWESNRLIPINIFLRKEMESFQYAIKTFITKDLTIVLGPVVNLFNLSTKRVKRKTVHMVRTSKPK